MDEKTENLTASEVIPGARYADPRPTDLQVFYSLLPGVLGSLAAKSTDSRSANAMAFTMVREALGQCAAMGIMRVVTQCIDGTSLAALSNNPAPMGGQQTMQGQGNGSMVQQYSNHPGQGQAVAGTATGGVVQQYPNYPPPQQVGGNGGQGGNKGVLVAMFPNGQNPPQL